MPRRKPEADRPRGAPQRSSRPQLARKPPSQRQLRVGEELRHVLASLLRPGTLREPALRDATVTVTEVRLSPDLRNATAFVMPLGGGDAADIIAALHRCAPYLRGRVAREVALRLAPNLTFALDRSFDQAERIAALLATPTVARDITPQSDENGKPDDAG